MRSWNAPIFKARGFLWCHEITPVEKVEAFLRSLINYSFKTKSQMRKNFVWGNEEAREKTLTWIFNEAKKVSKIIKFVRTDDPPLSQQPRGHNIGPEAEKPCPLPWELSLLYFKYCLRGGIYCMTHRPQATEEGWQKRPLLWKRVRGLWGIYLQNH